MKPEAGKGSRPRPVDGDKYRENYDLIFKSKKQEDVDTSEERVEETGKQGT
jgi:hypothetical protein